MKVFITGGAGFVGSHLTQFLLDRGHTVTIMSRIPKSKIPGLKLVAGNGVTPGPWQKFVGGHDAVVNLAGVSIFSAWTPVYKRQMWESRIMTTKHLIEAIPQDSGISLISTSAVGYYGFHGDEELDESSPAGSDFLALLAVDWETAASTVVDKGSRCVITRFGVVLGRNGGALKQMAQPFRFFVGGPVGSGEQWVSWIHMEDLCRALLFCLENPDVHGPVNCTSPNPVQNKELTQAIASALHRPAVMRAPGFALKLILGEFGSVLLEGQRVLPKALLDKGFVFEHPDVHEAVRDLLV